MESNYWSSRVSRRTALRGTGLGLAGIAGAALIGCGGKKTETQTTGEARKAQPGTAKRGSPADPALPIVRLHVRASLPSAPPGRAGCSLVPGHHAFSPRNGVGTQWRYDRTENADAILCPTAPLKVWVR